MCADAPNRLSIFVQLFQQLFFILDSNLVCVLAVELALGLQPSACVTPAWHGAPPWAGRLALRTLYLGSQLLLAQALLAGEGDLLLSLQSLIGAVGMTAFTYFLPFLIHASLSRAPLSAARKAWAAVNVTIGLLVMAAGLVAAVRDLSQSAGGYFSGTCKLKYAYSPRSESDPCSLSGLPRSMR